MNEWMGSLLIAWLAETAEVDNNRGSLVAGAGGRGARAMADESSGMSWS